MGPQSVVAGGIKAIFSGTKAMIQEKALGKVPTLLRLNQPDGFDCPGCAWPEEEQVSAFEFCENGMKAIAAETTSKRVDATFFAQNAVQDLKSQSDYWLEQQGRLTEPMRYNPRTDCYTPISWKESFAMLGSHLRRLENPNQAAFYTSGRTSNEAAFLYQLFARELGTNNLPDCSNMCHESSGVAMTEAVGVGKGTVSVEDFLHSDLILIFGQNPGTNHPRMLAILEKARTQGAEIISFNPLKEAGLLNFIHPQRPVPVLTNRKSELSSQYYQVKVGGDMAALQGVVKHVLELAERDKSILDRDFIQEHTAGFEALRESIQKTSWSLIEQESGLAKEILKKVADTYCKANKVIACWAMGITQHTHGVGTIQYITNLLLLRGNIGRKGAGLCPVRGHSNVQGDRTVGITEKPKKIFLDRIQEVFGFAPPIEHGVDAVECIEQMAKGRIKVFMGLGGNFAAATPDTHYTELALRKCDLTVHVSTKLNRSHLVPGKEALIFPCLGRTEKDIQNGKSQKVTVEDSMSMVHASQGKNTPASPHLLSEPAIVTQIAEATFPHSSVPWKQFREDYSLIRAYIEKTIPDFAGYNQKIQTPGGFHLRNSAKEREWNTQTGKAQFTTYPLQAISLRAGELRLMTLRSHDQYNTTVYGLNDRYRGIQGERWVLFLNTEDMEERDLQPSDLLHITSRDEQGVHRHASGFKAVPYDIPKGSAAAYFPEANVLVSIHSTAIKSNTPVSKLIPIQIEKA